jgi:NAD(P)-dependent dehydrogenase (short-subunit alcohol dehydrogenase family)
MEYARYPDLAGKLAVVTGGGSGIGAAIVEAFAGQGAQVVFLDVQDGPSQDLAARLAGLPRPPRYVHCDLTDLDQLGAVFAAIARDFGAADILVNNAANDGRHQLQDVSAQYWDNSLAVNLRHQFFCTQAVAPGMQAKGGGVVLNFGSISWHLALPEMPLYLAAKSAIEGLTRGLARDLGPHGIRVNCIVPGAVNTPRQMALWQTPESEAAILAAQCLPQRVQPEDVAALTLFLASANAARCSGREYFVDAGWYGA